MDTLVTMGQMAWEIKWWIAAIVIFLVGVFAYESSPLAYPLQED